MAQVIDPNAIYTTDEVAGILDLKAGTIRRLIRIGKLPATKIGTRRYYVRGADLLALVPAQTVEVRMQSVSAANERRAKELADYLNEKLGEGTAVQEGKIVHLASVPLDALNDAFQALGPYAYTMDEFRALFGEGGKGNTTE